MPHTTDEDTRDTLPPSPMTEPPPAPPEGLSTLGEMSFHEDPESWAGFDESKFMHRATSSVIKLTAELLKAKQNWDVEAIVQRQAVLFEEKLSPKLDGFGTRLKANEDDVKSLRTELGQVRDHLRRLEEKIAHLTGQQQ